jgi:cleavage stimulation factor subunit 2
MNRKLRVDYSNDAGGDDDSSAPANYQNMSQPQMPMPSNGHSIPPPPQSNSTLPPLPLGIDLPLGLTCPDAISRTLNTLPPAQLLDVLSQMKTLTATDPAKATELLHQAPQLSYAIFQALLLMGLVSTDALSSVVEAASSAPAPAPVPPPMQNQQYPVAVPAPGGFAPGYPPPPPHMSGPMGGTPPVPGRAAYPPPPPPQVQPPQQALPDAEALMQQVLAMPQEVIDSLPPADRQQIMALRASYGR